MAWLRSAEEKLTEPSLRLQPKTAGPLSVECVDGCLLPPPLPIPKHLVLLVPILPSQDFLEILSCSVSMGLFHISVIIVSLLWSLFSFSLRLLPLLLRSHFSVSL